MLQLNQVYPKNIRFSQPILLNDVHIVEQTLDQKQILLWEK